MRTIIALLALTLSPALCVADKPVRPRQPPDALQPAINAVLGKVTPSVVSLWFGKPPRHVSGVLISKDGLVLTCGHLSRKVDESVEIRLVDGKKVEGKVLARHKEHDLALVRIVGKESWPAVEIGSSETLTGTDPLLALGFGSSDLHGKPDATPPCSVRLGYRLEAGPRGRKDVLTTTILSAPGDSGGPLFDLTGGLVGVCSSSELDGTHTGYVSTATLLRSWKDLAAERPAPAAVRSTRRSAETAAQVIAEGVRRLRPSVVEVRCDDRWAGVGVYVGEGFVVTKASELSRNIAVVLPDGVVAGASLAGRDPPHDLALLRLWAPNLAERLPPVRWADTKDLPPGAVVAAVTPAEFTPPVGVICSSAHEVPPLPGILPIQVKDGKGGVEISATFADLVTRWLRRPAFPLKEGDVITGVAGIPVKDREGFFALFKEKARVGAHPRVIGESILVTYRRKDKTSDVLIHLRNQHSVRMQLVRPCSYRYSGFPSALVADFAARPEHCGSPVIDAEGRAVGLLIARAPFVESLVLPAAEVSQAVEVLQRSAATKK